MSFFLSIIKHLQLAVQALNTPFCESKASSYTDSLYCFQYSEVDSSFLQLEMAAELAIFSAISS